MNTKTSTNFSRTNYSHKQQIVENGVSSLKCLDGEDLNFGNRKRLQNLQQNDWITQQIQEKEDRKQRERDEERAFAEQTKQINEMRVALENNLKNKRRDWEKSTKEFNAQQVQEKFDREQSNHAESQAQNKDHITYCNTNAFQTENTRTCQSVLSQNRVIPYHWKGMNSTERKDIILEQDSQRQEQKILNELEKAKEKAFAIEQENNRLMLVNLDRQQGRNHMKIMDEVREFNLLAAKEQKIKLQNMYE